MASLTVPGRLVRPPLSLTRQIVDKAAPSEAPTFTDRMREKHRELRETPKREKDGVGSFGSLASAVRRS